MREGTGNGRTEVNADLHGNVAIPPFQKIHNSQKLFGSLKKKYVFFLKYISLFQVFFEMQWWVQPRATSNQIRVLCLSAVFGNFELKFSIFGGWVGREEKTNKQVHGGN